MFEVERARTLTLEAQTRAQQEFLCSKDIPTGYVGGSHRRTSQTDTDKALAAGSRRVVTVAELARKLGGNGGVKSPFISREFGSVFYINYCIST
jgi:hypothetical protein